MTIVGFTANLFRCSLTMISPALNAKVLHRVKTGNNLNMRNPVSLSEKLVTLKIQDYNHNALVKKCADKYQVREYVKDHGYGFLLNELIAVYDTVDEIQWDLLPQQFAMKWNFGCGYNIICSCKDQLDIENAIKKMRLWGHKQRETYLSHAELQYKGVPKKIIVEKYLHPSSGDVPPDYKIYCFHGVPLAVLFIADRTNTIHPGGFFDIQWNYLGVPINENHKNHYCKLDSIPLRPHSLDTMLECSKALSEPFPFVRCDFYDIDGVAVFGEMTFTPAGGHDVSQIEINGKKMGSYL